MGKRRLIGKIVILMLGLAAVVILAANSDTIPVSTPKKGYRVVIDPGHGGSDCGAVGVSGVKEAGLNLAVSLYLKEELEALGMEAILTRSDERALAEGKKADMAARGKIMNGEGVDLVVSVHMNKFTDPSVHGPMAFYMKGSAEGEKLAKTVIDSITDELGAPRRIANPGDYYVIRESMPVSVLVECGFPQTAVMRRFCSRSSIKRSSPTPARGFSAILRGIWGVSRWTNGPLSLII